MSKFSPNILVIDDNEDFAQNLMELVEDFGFKAAVVNHGRAAEAEIRKRSIDLALIDLNLPDVGGLDLLTVLRRRHPSCLCIVVTGNATIENAVQALNRGAFSYLVKGAEAEEYRSVIQNALNFIKSKKEVSQLRENHQAIIENFPGRIIILDGHGRVLHTNEFPVLVESFFTDDLPVLLGKNTSQQQTKMEPWKREILDCFLNLVSNRAPAIIPELSVPNEDGEPFHYKIHLIPLHKDVAQYLIFILDVSESVQLREDIKKSEQLATIGELAMTIAHEIRNPLTGISGAVQVLQGKMEPDNTDRQVCREVISLVDRLNRTIEDLLLMARPLRLDFVSATLGDVFDSFLKLFKEDQQYRDINIETHYQTKRDRFLGDPFRIQQAIANVVMNAAQAMEGKGTITITISRSAQTLKLCVNDEGPGFPENVNQLLEPFYTTKPAGTGLGLCITSRILEAHNGSMSLRNRELGAEVSLTIPAADAKPDRGGTVS